MDRRMFYFGTQIASMGLGMVGYYIIASVFNGPLFLIFLIIGWVLIFNGLALMVLNS